MATLSIEERLSLVEAKIAELELFKAQQEERDIALLARIDGFAEDLRRVERAQIRSFEKLHADQNSLRAEFRAHQEYVVERFNNVEADVSVLIDAAKSHRTAIEDIHSQVQELAAGQRQILEILAGGKPKIHD